MIDLAGVGLAEGYLGSVGSARHRVRGHRRGRAPSAGRHRLVSGLVFYGRTGRFTWRMGATVLGAQSVLVFFGALVARALAAAQDSGAATAYLLVGSALAVVCLLAAGLMRSPVGVTLGWLVQLACFATAVVVPFHGPCWGPTSGDAVGGLPGRGPPDRPVPAALGRRSRPSPRSRRTRLGWRNRPSAHSSSSSPTRSPAA